MNMSSSVEPAKHRSDRELHITVVSGFGGGGGELDVSHETALVKAALLYADRVTLASPIVAMLATVAPFLGLNAQERADAVLEIVGQMPGQGEVVAAIRALERKKRKTVEEHYRLRGLTAALKSSGDDMAKVVEDILTKAGVEELGTAVAAGVLDLDPLGFDEGGKSERVGERVTSLLAEVVAPGSTTFPLLDEDTAGLLAAMVKEGVAPVPAIGHLAQPAIATRWIGEMQAYPFADMKAVLDLRETLKDPLVRYRQAIIEVSDAFRNSPMSEAFGREAGDAYRKNVTPELLRLEELAKDKAVLALLRHAATSDQLAKVTGAALGFVGASQADMPQLVGAAAGVGVSTVASIVARRKDLSKQQRRSAYFYLFELERRSRR
jgi:hypothetical protein